LPFAMQSFRRRFTRATRRPTVNHQVVARILGEFGRIADTLRRAAAGGRVDPRQPPRRSRIPGPRRDAHGLLSGHGTRPMILKGNQRGGGADLAVNRTEELTPLAT
jgi:hypothetical protein